MGSNGALPASERNRTLLSSQIRQEKMSVLRELSVAQGTE